MKKLIAVSVVILLLTAMKVYGSDVAKIFCQARLGPAHVEYGTACRYRDEVMTGLDLNYPGGPIVRCARPEVQCF
jgi:hypothetical protein